MKMKKFAIIALALLAAAGCNKYEGSEFAPLAEITITGVDDATWQVLKPVRVEPTITGLDPADDYRYTWTAFNVANGAGRDTLSREHTLAFTPTFIPGQKMRLVFEVTNTRTGVSHYAASVVQTSTAIARGWFVLKDEGGKTDLDIVLPDGSLMENMVLTATGRQLEGKAVEIIFQPEYMYKNDAGLFRDDKKAWHLLSDRDMLTLDYTNLGVLKTFDQQFFLPVEGCAPQDIALGGSSRGWYVAAYLMNNNRIHCFTGMNMHGSQFEGGKLLPDAFTAEPRLHPAMIAHCYPDGNALVWDDANKSFFLALSNSIRLTPITELTADTVEWMGQQSAINSSNYVQGWVLSQKGGAWFLSNVAFRQGATMFVVASHTEIGVGRKFLVADVREAHGDGSYIWFGAGNELCYYQLTGTDATSTEKLLHIFAPGEQITRITHLPDEQSLAVLTSVGGDWKLYVFGLQPATGDLLPAAPAVYSGHGTARSVCHV